MTKTKIKRLSEAITWLRETLGWSYEEIGELVADPEPLSGATIRRWETGESEPRVSNRHAVFKLCDLHYYLTAAFKDPEDCRSWIERYHKGLEAKPNKLLEDGEFDVVIGELAALESGAFF